MFVHVPGEGAGRRVKNFLKCATYQGSSSPWPGLWAQAQAVPGAQRTYRLARYYQVVPLGLLRQPHTRTASCDKHGTVLLAPLPQGKSDPN